MKGGAYSDGAAGAGALLPGYGHRGHFWYVAHLLAHLTRPNEATKARVAAAASASGLRDAPRPLLGIHVRRGDSCRETQETAKARRCSPFAEYWYHALAMRARYGIRSVFLATDDAAVLAEATEAAAAAGLPLFASAAAPPPATADAPPPPLWDNVLDGTSKRAVDAAAAAAGVVDDLAILSRCDAFVGKFTSNLDRIAYALIAAKSRCLKPLVSLDSLWCHDWSSDAGRSLFGSFLC